VRIRPLAESALLVEFPGEAGPATTGAVVGLASALEAAAPPGLVDLVPAYTTLLVAFDPTLAEPDALAAMVRRLAAEPVGGAAPARLVTLPVAYGGDLGPDLGDVADLIGLAPGEVVARHAAGPPEGYLVVCLGFAPGFGYLLGLPPELAVPRLATPRTRVPAGSVAIGGDQTGVYPLPTPGGWRVVGRTPVPLFAPTAAEPFLLRAGDRLRFDPVSLDRYAEVEEAVASGGYAPEIATAPR
jgi:inhibitor of KinA